MYKKLRKYQMTYYYYDEKDISKKTGEKPTYYIGHLANVRKRPKMYISSLDSKGIYNIFRLIFKESVLNHESKIYLSFSNNKFSLKLENTDFSLTEFTHFIGSGAMPNITYLYVPLALGVRGKIAFKSSLGEELFEQHFENGMMVSDAGQAKKCEVGSLELDFELNLDFFDDEFRLNRDYLIEKFEEYAVCNKGTYIELSYSIDTKPQNRILHSKNGLKEKVDKLLLDTHDKTYLPLYIDSILDDFYLELAMGFLSNRTDKSYVKSYVNSECSIYHGTHLDAVVIGIKEALIEYLKSQGVENNYHITHKKILNYIILVVQIKTHPIYGRSLLGNDFSPEYIQPFIISHVKEVVLAELNRYSLKELAFLKVFKRDWCVYDK